MTTVRAKKSVTINYQNGKIYKIVNDVNDMLYIGSTTTLLTKRLYGHKASANNPKLRTNFHVQMSDIGIEHFQIILIELFPCVCKAELEAREYEVMSTYDKKKLYNSITSDKGIRTYSESTLAKMSANSSGRGKFQEQNPCFKRGSIYIIVNDAKKAIYFKYYNDHRKSISKIFCFAKIRSRETAYLMAIDAQNSIFPFTHKEYQSELPFYEV